MSKSSMQGERVHKWRFLMIFVFYLFLTNIDIFYLVRVDKKSSVWTTYPPPLDNIVSFYWATLSIEFFSNSSINKIKLENRNGKQNKNKFEYPIYFQKSKKSSIVNLVIKILSLPGCLLDKDLKTAGIELLKSLLVSPREAEITKRKKKLMKKKRKVEKNCKQCMLFIEYQWDLVYFCVQAGTFEKIN